MAPSTPTHLLTKSDDPLGLGSSESLVTQISNHFNRVLSLTIDHRSGATVRDEGKEFAAALLDFAKAKLAMPGLEAEKVAAEIGKVYAERTSEMAEARRRNAEAAAIEQMNNLRDLKLTLGMMKASLAGNQDAKALLLGQQIDFLLEVVKELTAS